MQLGHGALRRLGGVAIHLGARGERSRNQHMGAVELDVGWKKGEESRSAGLVFSRKRVQG